jgi:hypothetical protein
MPVKRQNPVLLTRLRTAALTLATDADLCRMFGMTVEMLAPYRDEIEAARTQALVAYRHMRERARNRRAE